jgi:Arc/MetJ-type ribon-helix-helix transcriptional regulator
MLEPEKITINVSAVDLGRIDLLAEEGFYSNRTDFIRTAIRKELDSHDDAVKQSATRRSSVIGVVTYSKGMLEGLRKKKKKVDMSVVGGVFLGSDVTPELARATIARLKVHGVLRASREVKEALADRMD